MPTERLLEEANFIPRDELFEHVSISLAAEAAGGLPQVFDWKPATIGRQPLEIYDLNGKLLFLDYPVRRGSDMIGSVRTAASKVVGSPIVSYQIGPRPMDFSAAEKKTAALVKKEYPQAKIAAPKLVCYGYPKLGLLYEVTGNGRPARMLFDLADLQPVPAEAPKPGFEGRYAWSFYDSLADEERQTRLKRFGEADKRRLAVPAAGRAKIRTARTISGIVNSVELPKIVWLYHLLPYCNHYGPGETRSHHCFVLHGQTTSDYCAVATCEMILCFYRYYYTQDQIATPLGYTPGGGCPTDQSPGYKTLTAHHLDATYDSAPSFAKCESEINALHPFKSGIPHHARACAGYAHYSIFGNTVRSLYIYDPWGADWDPDYKVSGAVSWESWDSGPTHTNCIWTNIHMD